MMARRVTLADQAEQDALSADVVVIKSL